MNYYAVNNNSRSLSHHGIKGMKWGIIRTDAQLGHPKAPSKPRSSAYLKAKQKLSEGMKKGIEKAKDSWREYNAPENKEYRAYKKSEKLYQKHLQQARKGKLKYKNVKSDDELYRITERLNSERASRALSNAEQGFISRFKKSVGEGLVQGAGKGASAYVEARFKGRGETDAAIKKEKRMAAFHNSLQGRIAQSRENRYEKREAKAEEKRDYKVKKREEKHADKLQNRKDKRALKKEYKTMIQEDGADYRIHGVRNSTRRKRLAEMKDKRQALEDRRKAENAYQMSLATKRGDRESLREHNQLEDERKFRLNEREYMRNRLRARYEQAEHNRDIAEGRIAPSNDFEKGIRSDYKAAEHYRNEYDFRRQAQEQARIKQEQAEQHKRYEQYQKEQREQAERVRLYHEQQRRLQQQEQERQRRLKEQQAEQAAADYRKRQEKKSQSAAQAAEDYGKRQQERAQQGRFDRLDPEIERMRRQQRLEDDRRRRKFRR